MNVLVVGCGSIGRRHIGNILKMGGHQVSAVDSVPAAAERAREMFKISVHNDLSKALDQKFDCVFISTPPSDHIPSALAAAKKGCHLFIEKPLSHDVHGIEELTHVVDDKKLITMVGCNMRFHPNIQFMKQFIESGRLGRLYSVYAEVGFFLPVWRPGTDYRANYAAKKDEGGGVLLDSIHEMDYVQWIAGEIKSVRCEAVHVSNLEIQTEDVAVVLMKFKNGAVGQLHLDYLQQDYSRGSKWIGEKGVLVWDMSQKQVRFFDNGEKRWSVVHALKESYDLNEIYEDEIRSFFSAVENKVPPMSSLHEATRVLDLTLSCKEQSGWSV